MNNFLYTGLLRKVSIFFAMVLCFSSLYAIEITPPNAFSGGSNGVKASGMEFTFVNNCHMGVTATINRGVSPVQSYVSPRSFSRSASEACTYFFLDGSGGDTTIAIERTVGDFIFKKPLGSSKIVIETKDKTEEYIDVTLSLSGGLGRNILSNSFSTPGISEAKATTKLTIISDNPSDSLDNEITIDGVTITLDQGDSRSEIASKIVSKINETTSLGYTASSIGGEVLFTRKTVGVNIESIDIEDNFYGNQDFQEVNSFIFSNENQVGGQIASGMSFNFPFDCNPSTLMQIKSGDTVLASKSGPFVSANNLLGRNCAGYFMAGTNVAGLDTDVARTVVVGDFTLRKTTASNTITIETNDKTSQYNNVSLNVALNAGIAGAVQPSVVNREFTTNGTYGNATAVLTITEDNPSDSVDNLLNIGGIDVSISVGDTKNQIATKITTAVNSGSIDFTASSSNNNVTFTRRTAGKNESRITFNDRDYGSTQVLSSFTPIRFVGGSASSKATATLTLDGALDPNEDDIDITIDGVTISLKKTDGPITMAGKIAEADFSSKDYIVSSSDNVVIFTKRSDGANTDIIPITDPRNAPPVFNTPPSYTLNVNENDNTFSFTPNASDADGDTITYSISGTDSDDFNINSNSGVVTFKVTPNYEDDRDSNGDNIYEFNIVANDGISSIEQEVKFTVINLNDNPPVFSTSQSSSFTTTENSVLFTLGPQVTDADGNLNTITYSISGTDAGDFSINSNTGTISFVQTPNYEVPKDANTDNIYDITVSVTDTNTMVSKNFSITVTNVNEAPTVNPPASTLSVRENNATYSFIVSGTDPEGNSLSYSIKTGSDGSSFKINSTTGEVTFKTPPNFEAKNSYSLTIRATDGGGLFGERAFTIGVLNVNERPIAPISQLSFFTTQENNNGFSFTPQVEDPDSGDTLNYTIYNSGDSSFFKINSTTGKVEFITPPNFEDRRDANNDNIYTVGVIAIDAGELNTGVKFFEVNITDVDERPVFNASIPTTFTTAENNASFEFRAQATDPEGKVVTYDLVGSNDDLLFNINETTGEIKFRTTPDFENKTDANNDGVYIITVKAQTGGSGANPSRDQNFEITVTNINDETPKFSQTNFQGVTTAENNASFFFLDTATDPDGNLNNLVYSLGGIDADLFNINETTGNVTFKQTPDFENPLDDGGAGDPQSFNTYSFNLIVSDGVNEGFASVKITVTNLEEPFKFTEPQLFTIQANESNSSFSFTPLIDNVDNNVITYNLTGTDSNDFNINSSTGEVTFKTTPDFENPLDDGENNKYGITIKANNTLQEVQANFLVEVLNLNDEAPTLTNSSLILNLEENNKTTPYLVTNYLSDRDIDKDNRVNVSELSNFNFLLTGADSSLFNFNSATGRLEFIEAPNFENPQSANNNNLYELALEINDSVQRVTQTIRINITNVNERPVISTQDQTILENENLSLTIQGIDPEGNDITYTNLAGADGDKFNFNRTTGEVTFKATPDFENPTDNNTDNKYEITVFISDGSLTGLKSITIEVLNYPDNPPRFGANTKAVNQNENEIFTNYTANATDSDEDIITYSIESGNDNNLFRINPKTGALVFTQKRDYETDPRQYNLTIKASDGFGNQEQGFQNVTINILDVNEKPTFNQDRVFIDFANGVNINPVTFTAQDPEGKDIEYELVLATGFANLSINSATGVLSGNLTTDKPTITIGVRATDEDAEQGRIKVFLRKTSTQDEDLDGVENSRDKVFGNKENIKFEEETSVEGVEVETTEKEVVVEVNSSQDLSKNFTKEEKVEIKDGTNPIVEFNHNFSRGNLNLSKIRIVRNLQNEEASISSQVVSQLDSDNKQVESGEEIRAQFLKRELFSGIELDSNDTKTVYFKLQSLDGDRNTFVCVVNREITQLSEIGDCNNENDYLVEVSITSGAITNPFSHTIPSTSITLQRETADTLKVSGLSHSALAQTCISDIDYSDWQEVVGDSSREFRTGTDLNGCQTGTITEFRSLEDTSSSGGGSSRVNIDLEGKTNFIKENVGKKKVRIEDDENLYNFEINKIEDTFVEIIHNSQETQINYNTQTSLDLNNDGKVDYNYKFTKVEGRNLVNIEFTKVTQSQDSSSSSSSSSSSIGSSTSSSESIANEAVQNENTNNQVDSNNESTNQINEENTNQDDEKQVDKKPYNKKSSSKTPFVIASILALLGAIGFVVFRFIK